MRQGALVPALRTPGPPLPPPIIISNFYETYFFSLLRLLSLASEGLWLPRGALPFFALVCNGIWRKPATRKRTAVNVAQSNRTAQSAAAVMETAAAAAR